MPTELEELVGFIANPSQQIRLIATENLVPYSTSEPALFKIDNLTPVKNLKLLVNDHPVSPRLASSLGKCIQPKILTVPLRKLPSMSSLFWSISRPTARSLRVWPPMINFSTPF